MAREINGLALGSILAGSVFIYAGIKGTSVLTTVRDVVSGQAPSNANANPISGATSTGASGGSTPVGNGADAPSGAGALSGVQVAQVAHGAGFSGQALVNMVAIAKRESGWNPQAHNTNAGTGDNSYGLWQINMLGNLGPTRLVLFGIQSNDALFDPATNARAAWILSSHGTNFTPWSTWRGLSSADLQAAQQAVHAAGLD